MFGLYDDQRDKYLEIKNKREKETKWISVGLISFTSIFLFGLLTVILLILNFLYIITLLISLASIYLTYISLKNIENNKLTLKEQIFYKLYETCIYLDKYIRPGNETKNLKKSIKTLNSLKNILNGWEEKDEWGFEFGNNIVSILKMFKYNIRKYINFLKENKSDIPALTSLGNTLAIIILYLDGEELDKLEKKLKEDYKEDKTKFDKVKSSLKNKEFLKYIASSIVSLIIVASVAMIIFSIMNVEWKVDPLSILTFAILTPASFAFLTKQIKNHFFDNI